MSKSKEMIRKTNTKNSIVNEILTADNNRYFIYRYFHNSNTVLSAEEITNYTLEIAPWIKDIYNKLISFEFNPYVVCCDRIRCFNDFENHLKNDEFDDRVICDEEMMQRHLAKHNELYPYLESIIDYECVIPHEKKKASIDLLSYKLDNEGNLVFIISELKVCDLHFCEPHSDDPVNKVKDKMKCRETSAAKDILLRAMMEAATYGCYFYYALKDANHDLFKYLRSIIGAQISDEQIINAKIEYYIVAPQNIVNQWSSECLSKFDKSKFTFFSIEQNNEYSEVGFVKEDKKYFNIEKVN